MEPAPARAAAKSLLRASIPARRRGRAAALLHEATALVARADPHDLAAALLFATLVVLVLATFGDYAISNDEPVQQRYGELIVAYYGSGFADQAVFHFKNLYLYGGLFDLIAVGLEKLVPLDPYAVRHVFCGLVGIAGIAAAWATARMIASARAGLIAAAALAACGIWYGAMFNHTKDIPFAAAMMGASCLLLRIGRALPRPPLRLVLGFGVLAGCALGLRVLGLLLASYAGFIVAAYSPLAHDPEKWEPVFGKRSCAKKNTRGRLAYIGRATLALAPACVVAYAIMIAAWPWAALAPLNPLRAMSDFAAFHYQIHTLLSGHMYEMADVPRWYVPAYLGIKLTLPLLAGAALALVFAARPGDPPADAAASRWREVAFVAFTAFFPPLCYVAAHGPAFSGMRHFLFTVPPIAVLAGLGLDGALGRLARVHRLAAAAAAAALLAGLGWNAATLYRLHPDEYLFFNPLVGGLEGASGRYDTDYWVNIMPEAVGDLEHFLDRTEPGRKGILHHYTVAVCGERLPFEKEADARLAWADDWKRADFFIAPTNMNCDRALDGRVVATVARLGVPIGVVKDRRAITRPSLAQAH